jgi:O-antigen ligase
VRWAFYIFVLSLPFEYPQRSIPFEVTTLTGCLLLLGALWNPRVCFGHITLALGCFAIFLYTYIVAFVMSMAAYPDEAVRLFLSLLQLVLVLWVSSNLMRDERTATVALWVFAIACILRAMLQLAGIGGTAPAGVDDTERQSLFRQNANLSANILAAGLLALVGLAYLRQRSARHVRLFAWPFVVAVGMAIVHTGSRGGLVALATGLLVMALSGRTARARIRNLFVTLVAAGILTWIGYNSELVRERFELAREGNLAGREAIYPAAWQMFLERPLVGWGPGDNMHALAGRLVASGHTRRDPHNLILELLTATGILGAGPFLIGVWLCVRAAWNARHSTEGVLPLAMISAVLVGNMSGNYIASKLLWLVLAYALSSSRRYQSPTEGLAIPRRGPPFRRPLAAARR